MYTEHDTEKGHVKWGESKGGGKEKGVAWSRSAPDPPSRLMSAYVMSKHLEEEELELNSDITVQTKYVLFKLFKFKFKFQIQISNSNFKFKFQIQIRIVENDVS